MAKKIVKKHTNKIVPALDTSRSILFDELSQGECFLMNGNLYMKESVKEQIGVNLTTGKYEDCLCECSVVPVEITIAWKKK